MPNFGLRHANNEKNSVTQKDVEISWLVFVFVAVTGTAFSAAFLDPASGALSASAALCRCLYWILAAIVFGNFVLCYLGGEEATSWAIGYMLEFALSFDNLFLFHVAFKSYGTPVDQVYRGIVTAMRWGIVVRFTLFFVSEEVFHLALVVRWIFGGLLLYSGFKIIVYEEDDGDPTDNCLVRLITRYLPVHKEYVEGGALFVCGEDRADRKMESVAATRHGVPTRNGDSGAWDPGRHEDAVEAPEHSGRLSRCRDSHCCSIRPSKCHCSRCCSRGCKATPLLLAILTLMIIDALFAVDSVTAKVSMVSQYDEQMNLLLNFTSTAFAMLCMPSLYFIIELMVNLFRYLKYGLGAILILIGLKLLSSEYIHIREDLSCLVMVGILGLSILVSLLLNDSEKVPEGLASARDPELSSPQIEISDRDSDWL